MANIKAKIKNISKIEQQNIRNRKVKSTIKTAIKKAKIAIESHDENASFLIANAHKEINVAVSKGVIHKNKGSRKTARLDLFAKKHQINQKNV